MLSWAVSLVLMASARVDDGQYDLSPKEAEVWQRLQKGIVTLDVGGVPGGTAALIDSSGLFLAHQSSVDAPVTEGYPVVGTLSNGRTLRFAVISRDSLTKLVLLQARDWQPEFGTPVRVPVGDETGHGMVFAVLPTGPIRAAFTKLNRAGFVQAERRIIPLNEVQFEAPQGGCAGALLIDEDGELLGVLNATLSNGNVLDATASTSGRVGGYIPINTPQGRGPEYVPSVVDKFMKGRQKVGPSDLVVAYTAGVVVLKKVVDGFRSSSHRVAYPSIGLLCKDTPSGGALVQAVQPVSPADQAGLRVGDVLLNIAGVAIRNQVDFALVMLNQTPGDSISVQYRRRNKQLVQMVTVGHS